MDNPKNFGTSSAASDLGLGDMVHQELEDNAEERKKKLLNPMMNNASAAYSPATLSLLGSAGGFGSIGGM